VSPAFVKEAVARIAADFHRSGETHLIRLDVPSLDGIDIYLKDESTHPSGSLKHRLARSLFLYGLCNGWIGEETTIIESSSGSTAISEAYFARLLGLRFVAVVPDSTAPEKIAQIEFHGAEVRKVAASAIYDEARRLAAECGGHYMDQFTYAERATDWRGNNNIADSIFTQMERERFPVPRWIVVSAGTGGTSSTVGRYVRFRADSCGRTQLAVVDPENSVFYDYWATGDRGLIAARPSRIEGIGRPRVEPSFLREVVDHMMRVPDAASIATLGWLEQVLGRRCGGSTGTNVWGALTLASQMRERGETGSIVTLICDPGERYLRSYFDPLWVSIQGLDPSPYRIALAEFTATGRLAVP
jgi:cysteine synthase A